MKDKNEIFVKRLVDYFYDNDNDFYIPDYCIDDFIKTITGDKYNLDPFVYCNEWAGTDKNDKYFTNHNGFYSIKEIMEVINHHNILKKIEKK